MHSRAGAYMHAPSLLRSRDCMIARKRELNETELHTLHVTVSLHTKVLVYCQ